jgi:FixJ family two-component response regulator
MDINICISVLDDEEKVLRTLDETFKEEGITNYRLYTDEKRFLGDADENINMAIIDYALGGELNGVEVCRLLLEKSPHCLVIIITGQGDPDVIIDFMNSGAWRYVRKWPPDYPKQIVQFIRDGAKEIRRDMAYYSMLVEQYKQRTEHGDITGLLGRHTE